MKEEFLISQKFSRTSRADIARANTILEEYAAQGFVMTLRQLHYQFVARNHYENTMENYKRLGALLSKARLSGLVDWDLLEDRARSLVGRPSWSAPDSIISGAAFQYREDLWAGQEFRPEVWIEKEALAGVISGICNEFRVDYFACKGYVSQSAQYEAAKRLRAYYDNGQTPIVFHLGDHDPSGLDMTRENQHKIELLTRREIRLVRLALNIEQVERYNPPPNPAKLSDVRAKGYIERFGEESWELDALNPPVIAQLIRDALEPLIDEAKWTAADNHETENRALLSEAATRWPDVRQMLTMGAPCQT